MNIRLPSFTAFCLAILPLVALPSRAAVTEAWVRRYDGPAHNNDYARAVAIDHNGNVVVTGSSYGDKSDYYTAKYAATDGALLWEKRFNGPANGFDEAQAVAVDGSGNVVVTGSSESTNSIADYYTEKYAAADGALLWAKRYDGPLNGFDKPQAVAVDFSGNVVVTGFSFSTVGTRDFYTAKYAAANGALLWEKRQTGPGGDREFGYYGNGLMLDAIGNVVVTGSSWNGSNDDYYTAKYATADGALLWKQRYNGPSNGFDEAQAVIVDDSGNVVVTGHSNSEYYTAKYAATDGALLWEKRDDQGGAAKALAVDASGNVVITGTDYYTVKHAAADGTVIWERRYNGPTNTHHYAQAVRVDGSGNVVVTGWSSSITSADSDYYTAKYAGRDGALLWEKRYNGPADKSDFVGDFVGGARTLAIGADGTVAIAGSSDGDTGSSPSFDYATVVYREVLAPIDAAFVGFATNSVSVPESEAEARVEVRRSGNLDLAVSVDYSTAPWNGAVSGQDYTEVSGTVSFSADKQSDFIRVPILNNDQRETLEGVQITLSNPSLGATLGVSNLVIRILDNDNQPAVGPLVATVGNQVYQDWSIQNVRWGQGYPVVNLRFDKEEARPGQYIWDNEIVRGSDLNDQPDFVAVYRSNLRVNSLTADLGQVKATYELEFATQLLDLMILDVDDEDQVHVEFSGSDGTVIDPRQVQRIMEGDLSRFSNAPGRPASELATPPVWDPIAGTLTAAVTWNENRSFTILRPAVPAKSITLTFTGKRTVAHIYAGLWATPRPFEVTEMLRTATGDSHLRWTSLPGVAYRIMRSSNLIDWVQAWSGHGAAAPNLTTEAIIPSPEAASPQFFKIQQW